MITAANAREYYNKKIKLAAGYPYGMGTLKKPIEVVICGHDFNTNYEVFFTAYWVDAKTGKYRYIYLSQNEVEDSASNEKEQHSVENFLSADQG